jgi:hypothetical protein
VIGNIRVHIVNRDRPIDNIKKFFKAACSQFPDRSVIDCKWLQSPPTPPAARNTQVEASAISSTPEVPKLNQSVPPPSPDSRTATSTDEGLIWKRSHLLSALKAIKIPHRPKASLGELRSIYDDHNDRREERNNPQLTLSKVERSLTRQHVSETSAAMPDPAASNSRSSAPIGAPTGPRMMSTTSPFRPLNRNESHTALRPQNSSLRPPAAQSNSSQRKQPVLDHQQAQGERLNVPNNQSKPPLPQPITDCRDAISGPPGPSNKAHDKALQQRSTAVAPGPRTIKIVGPCSSHTKASASSVSIPLYAKATTTLAQASVMPSLPQKTTGRPDVVAAILLPQNNSTEQNAGNTPLLAKNAETKRQRTMDVWSLQQMEKHFANPPCKSSVPGPSVEVPNKAMEPTSATVPSGRQTTEVVGQSSSHTNTSASSTVTLLNAKASTNSTQASLMPPSSQLAMTPSGAIPRPPGRSVETHGNGKPNTGITAASGTLAIQAAETRGNDMLNTGTTAAPVSLTTQAAGEHISRNTAAAPSIPTPLNTKAPTTHTQATLNTSITTSDEKSSHNNTAAPSISIPLKTKASTTPTQASQNKSLIPSSINPATVKVRDMTKPIFPESSPPAGPSTTSTSFTRPTLQQKICGPGCPCHNLFPDCLFPDEPCYCQHCTGEALQKKKDANANSSTTSGTSTTATGREVQLQHQSATEAPVPLWRRKLSDNPNVRITTPDGKKIKEFGKDGPIWRKETK